MTFTDPTDQALYEAFMEGRSSAFERLTDAESAFARWHRRWKASHRPPQPAPEAAGSWAGGSGWPMAGSLPAPSFLGESVTLSQLVGYLDASAPSALVHLNRHGCSCKWKIIRELTPGSLSAQRVPSDDCTLKEH